MNRTVEMVLKEARQSGALDELGAAFQAWAEEHGIVWFGPDLALAEAIADVLGIEFEIGDE